MKALVIDASKCNGCYNCQIACKDEHVGNDWSPYARPQPLIGHFWIKVIDKVRGTFPKVKVSYRPDICRHCANAPCISACKYGAIDRREDGIVLIDPDRCRGEKDCVAACPYGAVYFNEDLNIAQKCTLCTHLLDKGEKEPRCVEVCPTGALVFGEEEGLGQLIDRSEMAEPEHAAEPRVHYIGLPKRFIAGAVYDPSEDECIEGALVTVVNREDGVEAETLTDEFGDFWLEGLKAGDYSLTIEKEGYGPYRVECFSVEEDVNLGDIALTDQETART